MVCVHIYVLVLPLVCTQGSEDILDYPVLSLFSLFFEKQSLIDPGARLAARKSQAFFCLCPLSSGVTDTKFVSDIFNVLL